MCIVVGIVHADSGSIVKSGPILRTAPIALPVPVASPVFPRAFIRPPTTTFFGAYPGLYNGFY